MSLPSRFERVRRGVELARDRRVGDLLHTDDDMHGWNHSAERWTGHSGKGPVPPSKRVRPSGDSAPACAGVAVPSPSRVRRRPIWTCWSSAPGRRAWRRPSRPTSVGCASRCLDRATFPRDKTCGDGLTAGALRLLEELGVDVPGIASTQPVDDGGAARSERPDQSSCRSPATATTPSSPRGSTSTPRSSIAPARWASPCSRARRHGDRRSTRSSVTVEHDDGRRTTARLRHRGRRPLLDGAPSRGARARPRPRLVARVPPVLPRRRRRPALGALRSRPAAGVRMGVPAARRSRQRRLRRAARRATRRGKQLAALWRELLDRPALRDVLGPRAEPEAPHRAWPIPAVVRPAARDGRPRALRRRRGRVSSTP